MALSTITLPVSHLPRSSSFFLSALQPLGYRFLEQRADRHLGFGVDTPDFYLCQDNPQVQSGAADISFTAPSRAAVDAFYTAALRAGGSTHTPPTVGGSGQPPYRAAVLDLDGNLVEVVCTEDHNHNAGDLDDRRSVGPARTAVSRRVLTWQDDVARSVSDRESVMAPSRVTARPVQAQAGPAPLPATRTTTTTTTTETRSSSGDFSAKAIIGTLLGAAGGAAVAYAMMRAESEDEQERERAALSETPTHQIVMVDREVDARRSEVGGRSVASISRAPSIDRAPAAAAAAASVMAGGSQAGSVRTGALQELLAPHTQSALGTLISTFVPPSSVPRLLEAPPMNSTSRAASLVGGGVGGSGSVTGPAMQPRSQVSSSSAVTARELALPASRASTTVTARDTPLPVSSRSTTVSRAAAPSVVTVTPSESVSNAGSRRSKKSTMTTGGGGSSSSSSTIVSEKTATPAAAAGSKSTTSGRAGSSTSKSLPLRPSSSSSAAGSKVSSSRQSVAASNTRPSPLRMESGTSS